MSTLDKIRKGFGLDPIIYPKENLALKAPGYILVDGPAYCKYRLPCGMCERTGKDCSRDTVKETADKQIIAPVGTVKSVRIIEDDGRKRLIPLDKVIIERYEDGQI